MASNMRFNLRHLHFAKECVRYVNSAPNVNTKCVNEMLAYCYCIIAAAAVCNETLLFYVNAIWLFHQVLNFSSRTRFTHAIILAGNIHTHSGDGIKLNGTPSELNP